MLARASGDRSIGIWRFEILVASDGDCLVCYMGPSGVDEGAFARLDGGDFVVSRGREPPLRFLGVTPKDISRLASASAIFLNRSDDRIGHQVRKVVLTAED